MPSYWKDLRTRTLVSRPGDARLSGLLLLLAACPSSDSSRPVSGAAFVLLRHLVLLRFPDRSTARAPTALCLFLPLSLAELPKS